MKRFFDLLFSALALIVLMPIMLLVALWVSLDSKGGPFFKQHRVGRDRRQFKLLKFRSMKVEGEELGQLTTAKVSSRITTPGRFIRKTKLDELPQLINVLKGDMSLVGPRPEVPRYVDYYNEQQLEVLSVRPGITSRASVLYFTEEQELSASPEPEILYLNTIMPKKLELDLEYVNNKSPFKDLKILWATALRLLKR